MGFILLIVFPLSTLSIYVSSLSECQELGALNIAHWQQTGQIAKAICMKSFEV